MGDDEDLQAVCSTVSEAMQAVKAGMDALSNISKQRKVAIHIDNVGED